MWKLLQATVVRHVQGSSAAASSVCVIKQPSSTLSCDGTMGWDCFLLNIISYDFFNPSIREHWELMSRSFGNWWFFMMRELLRKVAKLIEVDSSCEECSMIQVAKVWNGPWQGKPWKSESIWSDREAAKPTWSSCQLNLMLIHSQYR